MLPVKPGLHISHKDGKNMLENMFFKAVRVWLGLCVINKHRVAGVMKNKLRAQRVSVNKEGYDCSVI